jgi:hypothetical protein
VRALWLPLLVTVACGTDIAEPLPLAGEPPATNTDPRCTELPPGAGDRQILRFEGGGTTAILTRDITGLGGGRTWIFEPRRFTVERDARTDCITDPAALAYRWTHHNWEDEAEATAAGLRWKLSMIRETSLEGGWTDTLEAHDANGLLIVGPIDMELLDGPRF